MEIEGIEVGRFTIRRAPDNLVDSEDLREAEQTRVLLEAGPLALTHAVISSACSSPFGFCKALTKTLGRGVREPSRLLHHFAYLVEAALLKRWLIDGRFEHVHAHFGTNSTTVAMLCRTIGGPPFSFTVHGIDSVDLNGDAAIRAKVAAAAMVMSVSRHGAETLQRLSTKDEAKIHLVRCIVPADLLKRDTGPPSPEPRLVFVGRLAIEKNPIMLIGAIAVLASDFPDIHLTIVGDGPLRESLVKEIASLRVQEHVCLAGWCDGPRVLEEIRASRALVLCSDAEGLPTVILEAFALGRPVVATAVGGVPEIVRSGETGWLIDSGSVEALTEAIRDALIASPSRLAKLADQGRRRVATNHDEALVGRQLAALFKHSVDQHRATDAPNS